MERYIVMMSAAKMPASCWGRYVRVGVVELDGTVERPAMLSERALGVVRVVETWERCRVGKTARSASQIALAEALALADQLNEQEG